MSPDIYSLLYDSAVFTTGIIESKKPYYIGRGDKRRRIGYKLLIRTPYTHKEGGNNIPIYISAYGRSDAWHSYRTLQKKKIPISVSGIRKATKLYRNRGLDDKFLIILARNPPPQFMPVVTKRATGTTL